MEGQLIENRKAYLLYYFYLDKIEIIVLIIFIELLDCMPSLWRPLLQTRAEGFFFNKYVFVCKVYPLIVKVRELCHHLYLLLQHTEKKYKNFFCTEGEDKNFQGVIISSTLPSTKIKRVTATPHKVWWMLWKRSVTYFNKDVAQRDCQLLHEPTGLSGAGMVNQQWGGCRQRGCRQLHRCQTAEHSWSPRWF